MGGEPEVRRQEQCKVRGTSLRHVGKVAHHKVGGKSRRQEGEAQHKVRREGLEQVGDERKLETRRKGWLFFGLSTEHIDSS